VSPDKGRKTPKRYVSLTSRDIIKASKKELMSHLVTPRDLSLKNRLNQKSSGASHMSMRTRRLANITMVTKNIRKGRLPPIKTPQQLDVFVFGEKSSSVMMRQHLDQSHGIIGPKSSLSRHHANKTTQQLSKDEHASVNITNFKNQTQKITGIKAKRGTQVEL